MQPKSKFSIGQKVYYKPKLSGFNNKKPLVIEYVNYKKTDELSECLGVEFKPTYIYHFKGINLCAIENNITIKL